MAIKKKGKKKATRSKKAGPKRTRSRATKSKAPKKSAVRKSTGKKKKTARAKARSGKTLAAKNRTGRSNRRRREPIGFGGRGPSSRSGGQSGDLQGVSDSQGSDSESVRELLEEGNTMEAEVVSGVQEAGDRSDKEVRTHQTPEDDVPEEYLDPE
jgi:hypothetical protein